MNPNPKYSLIETERKWIVNKDKLPDLSALKLREVTDKYFSGTRSRLRKIVNTRTNEIQYKLTKKYGKTNSQCEPITTLYLSEDEYIFFNRLEGNVLIKKLYSYPFSGSTFLIEIFVKPEVDFILLEVEAASEELINKLTIPDFVIREVTNEKSFEGYDISQDARRETSDVKRQT